MAYEKLASAIYNDTMAGLTAYSSTMKLSMEQLVDDIVDERLQVMKEYALKGILPKEDLLYSLNCIPVDCESLDRCKCEAQYDPCNELVAHFEVPQIAYGFGINPIDYVGSTDRMLPFIPYSNLRYLRMDKFKKRPSKKPFVWIDPTPNKNNLNDGFIFNAPLLKEISIVFIPKDPRQLDDFGCCPADEIDNLSFLNNEIKRRLTEKKIRYYRQLASPNTPNTQAPK